MLLLYTSLAVSSLAMRGEECIILAIGHVAELVYAYVSEAYPARVGSSSLPVPTMICKNGWEPFLQFSSGDNGRRESRNATARDKVMGSPSKAKPGTESPRAHHSNHKERPSGYHEHEGVKIVGVAREIAVCYAVVPLPPESDPDDQVGEGEKEENSQDSPHIQRIPRLKGPT